MTVAELIEELKKLPQDQLVYKRIGASLEKVKGVKNNLLVEIVEIH